MRFSTSFKLTLTFAAFAFGLAVLPRPEHPARAATDPPPVPGRFIRLLRGPIDTAARRDLDTSAADLANPGHELSLKSAPKPAELRIVQFPGPIKRRWYQALAASRAEIAGYLPDYAYCIRGTPQILAQIASLDAGEMADDVRPIRWMGRFEPVNKVDPALSDETLARGSADVSVDIELFDSPEAQATIAEIVSRSSRLDREPQRFLKFIVLSVTMPAREILRAAASDNVLFVGVAHRFTTHDERSSQIVAGNLTADGKQPSGVGYMFWLAAKGLNTPSDFAIDITDTGLDRGLTEVLDVHPDFLDASGQSRVSYNFNYANDGETDDRRGHGTIVGSIAA